MNELIYPNLFLFLYDWRDGLGEDQQDLANNQKIFAAKFPQSLRQSLFDRDTAFESEYLELLAQQIEEFPESDKPVEGYYYPVRLNDTYGLLLGCSFVEDTTCHPTSCIADFKAKIEKKLNDQSATIGQSWLILAHLDNSNSNPENVAKNCCQALNIGLNWEQDLQGQGRFLGGMIFELWRYELQMPNLQSGNTPAPTLQQIQHNNQHLIVSIYPNADTAKQAAEFYRSWMRLFSYRHQILWAYAQSRYLKQQLKKDFTVINQLAADINSQNLKKLRQTVVDAQNILPHYTNNLTYLDAQIRTIEINTINYSRQIVTISDRINQIQTQSGQDSLNQLLIDKIASWLQAITTRSATASQNQSALFAQLTNWQHQRDLNFLEKFSDDVAKKHQLQVQKDSETFNTGLQLLQDLINSTRTITEIEQAQRDRAFQNIVGIVGSGLAAASVAASLSGQFPTANQKVGILKQHQPGWLLSRLGVPDPWLVTATSGIFSIEVGIIVALFTAIMIWIKQRSPPKTR